MNTYDNNNGQTRRIRIQDFLGGQYLKQVDLDSPTVATIVNVTNENVKGEWKLVASFKELKKRLILNPTNLIELSRLFKATYPDEILGTVTLYIDPDVEMGGKIVGGIRVRAAGTANATNGQAGQPNEGFVGG